MVGMEKGNNTIAATIMRKLATWLWLNALTPLRGDMPSFIRMNELPHTAPNTTSNSAPETFFDMPKGNVKKFTTFYHLFKTFQFY